MSDKKKIAQLNNELFNLDILKLDENDKKGIIKIIPDGNKTKLLIECYVCAKNPDLDYSKVPKEEKGILKKNFTLLPEDENLAIGGLTVSITLDDEENAKLKIESLVTYKPPDGSNA